MDNFFTSMKLAQYLLARDTTILGTMNRQRRELPPYVREKANLLVTKVMKTTDATLTVYQSKPNKNVCILSTMHTGVSIGGDPKKKPVSVTDYNKTKYGVDIMDQMARKYSVKTATRRWPVAVFYNLLDLAAINAYVLYKQCSNNPKLTRRDFLQKLGLQLCKQHIEEKERARGIPVPRTPRRLPLQPLPTTPTNQQAAKRGRPRTPQTPETPETKKRRQCQLRPCGNKTKESCHSCGIRICGSCAGATFVTCRDCL